MFFLNIKRKTSEQSLPWIGIKNKKKHSITAEYRRDKLNYKVYTYKKE